MRNCLFLFSLLILVGGDIFSQENIPITDGFDYPIGNFGYDTTDSNEIIQISMDEGLAEHESKNNLYPCSPDENPKREGSKSNSYNEWHISQDVGNYLNWPYTQGIHPGEDWNLPGCDDVKKEVRAIAHGQIIKIRKTFSGEDGHKTGGWTIIMKHITPEGRKIYSIYSHVTTWNNTDGNLCNSATDFSVAERQIVSRGTPIARIVKGNNCGSSDPEEYMNLPTHLHFEIRNSNFSENNTLWCRDNGNGYYGGINTLNNNTCGNSGKHASTMNAEEVRIAYKNMFYDGVIDPSDFIDANRPLREDNQEILINYGLNVYGGTVSNPNKIEISFPGSIINNNRNYQIDNIRIDNHSIAPRFKDITSRNSSIRSFTLKLTPEMLRGLENKSYKLFFTIKSSNAPEKNVHVGLYFHEGSFSIDVPTTSWFAGYIRKGVLLGLFKGDATNQNKFYPKKQLTREQAAKVLVKAGLFLGTITLDVSTENGQFTDVSKENEFFPYIQTLRNKAFATIQNCNCFHPKAKITIAQFCAFLSRVLNLTSSDHAPSHIIQRQNTRIKIQSSDPSLQDDMVNIYNIIDYAAPRPSEILENNNANIFKVENLLSFINYASRIPETNEVIADGSGDITRAQMAKVLVNAYNVKLSEINSNSTPHASSRSTEYPYSLEDITIIGDKFEGIISPNTTSTLEPLSDTIHMNDNEERTIQYNSDRDNAGNPMFFYWAINGGKLESTNNIHRSVKFTPPSVTETTIFKLYTYIGNDQGGGAEGNITLIVHPSTPTLLLSPETYSIGPQGGTMEFEVDANMPWTISSNSSWLTLSHRSGTGNQTIQATISPNPEARERAAFVGIQGGGMAKYAEVRQTGASTPPKLAFAQCLNAPSEINKGDRMSISFGLRNIGSEDWTGNIWVYLQNSEVGSNYQFLLQKQFHIPKGEFLRIETPATQIDRNEGQYHLKVLYTNLPTAYFEFPKPETCSPTLSSSIGAYHYKVININNPISLEISPPQREISAEATSLSFEVQAFGNWTAISPYSWINVFPSEGSDNAWIQANIQANLSSEARTGEIILTHSEANLMRKATIIQAGNLPPCTLQMIMGITDANCLESNASVNLVPQNATPPYQIQWSTGLYTNSTTHNNLGVGSYSVSITDANNCTRSMDFEIENIGESPQANFSYNIDGLNVDFQQQSSGDGTSFSWDYGDNSPQESGIENPSHTFPASGTYYVCLTVSNPCGADTYCQNITVVDNSCNTIVTNTNDAGPGSLRSAMECANDGDRITFNIPGSPPHRIQLYSPLPKIRNMSLTIDGTSEAGNGYNGGPVKIELDGRNSVSKGIEVDNGELKVYGMYIHKFTQYGIYIWSSQNSCANHKIGSAGKGNVVSGNEVGVFIDMGNCQTGTAQIQDNKIGLNPWGGQEGNQSHGLDIDDRQTMIGGTGQNVWNTIAYNGGHGVKGGENILGNLIYCNSGKGIDKNGNKPTSNVIITGPQFIIEELGSQYRMEIFRAPFNCGGSCQGEQMMGVATYNNSTQRYELSGDFDRGVQYTYTRTNTYTKETSEFADCVTKADCNLSIFVSTEDATCGQSDGSASLDISGGNSPYEIVWSTGQYQNTTNHRSLASGNYSVTVTDVSGCSKQESFSISCESTCSLPSPWESQDIGNPNIAGESCKSGDSYILKASGYDIYNNYDEFQFAYQAFSGDGQIIARINRLEETHEHAKAGVMFRESLSSNSKHAMLVFSRDEEINFQYRSNTGGNTSNEDHTNGGNQHPPRWLKLVKWGQTMMAYYAIGASHNDNWIFLGQVNLPMNNNIYVGLCATSHNNNQLTTAVFDQVTINDSGPPNGDDCHSNIAQGRPSTASSEENSDQGHFPSSNAFDGNGGSRWASDFTDNEWIYVDLQGRYNICKVALNWEAAYAREYKIQVSEDASNWHTIHPVSNNYSQHNTWDNLSGIGRYVRMLGTKRATPYGYSLYEFKVYGQSLGEARVLSHSLDNPTLKLFPNPAKDQLNFEYFQTEKGEVRLSILNTIGQIIKHDSFLAEMGEINHAMSLADLPEGYYYLQLSISNGHQVSKGFSVKR